MSSSIYKTKAGRNYADSTYLAYRRYIVQDPIADGVCADTAGRAVDTGADVPRQWDGCEAVAIGGELGACSWTIPSYPTPISTSTFLPTSTVGTTA